MLLGVLNPFMLPCRVIPLVLLAAFLAALPVPAKAESVGDFYWIQGNNGLWEEADNPAHNEKQAQRWGVAGFGEGFGYGDGLNPPLLSTLEYSAFTQTDANVYFGPSLKSVRGVVVAPLRYDVTLGGRKYIPAPHPIFGSDKPVETWDGNRDIGELLTIDNRDSRYAGNWIFSSDLPGNETYNYTITLNRTHLFNSEPTFQLLGGDSAHSYTSTFNGVNVTASRVSIRGYNTLNFLNGTLSADTIELRENANFFWDVTMAGRVQEPVLKATQILGYGNNILKLLYLKPNSLKVGGIYGLGSSFTVHLSVNGDNHTVNDLPFINNADVFLRTGQWKFPNQFGNYGISLNISNVATFTAPDGMSVRGITVAGGGELTTGKTLSIPTLAGDGDIILSGNTTFYGAKDTGGGVSSYDGFTGTINLNGATLTLASPMLLGKTGTLKGAGVLDITTAPNDRNVISGMEFTGASGTLVLETHGRPLTIADSTGQGNSLHKTGEGELILSDVTYNFADMLVVKGTLTLANEVKLTSTTGFMVSSPVVRSAALNITGAATLDGDLSVDSARLILDGGHLNVTGVTAFTDFQASNLFYRGGLLTTDELDLGSKSVFSADLPHPGVFKVAEYGALSGVFDNLGQNPTQDALQNAVKVQGERAQGFIGLQYGNGTNDHILLEAANGYNILYRTGSTGDVWANNDARWQNLNGDSKNWINNSSHIAVFGAAGTTPYDVPVSGTTHANMLVFLDNGWKITSAVPANVPANTVILRPFIDDPASPYHHAVLNSQAPAGGNAPRYELPLYTSDVFPVWKTGAGDLVMASDHIGSQNGGFLTPPSIVIKDGRLILEQANALGGTIAQAVHQTVSIDPGSALALNFQSTDKQLYSIIRGAGGLEVWNDATLFLPIPDFEGAVRVSGGKTLTLQDRLAAGNAPGGEAVNIETGATVNLDYTDPDMALPRILSGVGSIAVTDGNSVRLAVGNSYAGGTTVGNSATLGLEGSGTGKAFSAAGSGSITLADNAGLNLLSGGILNNELGGVATSKLTLDADNYALTDNNIRTDGTDFTGDVGIAEGGALTLSADVTKGASVTPPFSISGSGGLILDGAGVTFSGLDGPAGSSKTGAFLGGTTIMDKTTLELASDYGRSGQTAITLLGADSLLNLNMNGNTTFQNVLSGTGTVRLFNNHTYTFSGNNMLFAGVIDVNGNTLAINAQSDIGDARLDLDGGTLDFGINALIPDNAIRLGDGGGTLSNLNSATLRGYITDADDATPAVFGNLTKTGTGILTLTNPNSDYQGGTNVNAGTLRLEGGGLTGTSGVTAANGATLSGYGRIAGDTDINSGGKFSVDGQFTFDKNLTVTMNLTGGLEFNHGGRLDVGGNLTLNDLNSTNKMLINLDSLGVYVLARYGSTNLASGAADLSGNYTLNYNSDDITVDPQYRNELVNYSLQKEILLITLPTGQKVEFWNNGNGDVWNTDGAKNWNSTYDAAGLTETWASDSRIAVFGTSGVTPGEVRVQEPVAASGLFFLTDGWTVSGGAITLLDLDPHDTHPYAVISAQEGNAVIDATLTGSAGLHKSGTAALTLNAANAYTGDTLVSSGTLALGNVYAAGSNQTITVEDGAFLRLTYNNSATALHQTVTGAGTLEISGNALLNKANTHTGGTSIIGGMLRLAHNDALGTGTLSFSNGLLSLANGLDVSNAIELNGLRNIAAVAGGKSATLSGVMTGGGLNKIGAGTLTLTGDNSFTGGLYLDQGKVVAGSDTALGHGTVRMADGATLGFSGNRTLKNDFSLNGTAFFEAAQTDGGTLDGILYGSGNLTKIGNGTLTLGGANTYTGLTDVREGTLALSTGGSISGQLALHGGTTFNAGGNAVRLARLEVHRQASYVGGLNTAGGRMTFSLPADVAPGTQPILNVTGTAEIGGSYVTLDLGGRQRTNLLPGHVLTLVGTSGGISGNPVNAEAAGHLGITRAWRAALWTDAHNLYAGVTHIGASEESKALSEGYLAGTALINRGADLAAGSGMSEAANASRRAARANADRGYGYAAFGTISGGWSRYNTGSHVDMSSLSLMTGISVGIGGADTALGFTTLGAFFEYGNGAYDTYNSFSNAASVHGDGDMYYLGGGLLGRMEFADTGPGRFYVEASGRMGKAYNEYDSSELRDSHTGVKANYDSSSMYYGLHFGTGYVWNMTEHASLDLYGKYFRTHQEGDKVTLANGDPVRFKGVDSQRLRLGGRFAYALDERVTPYIGAAYEHEFDGKARASTYGYAIDTPSLRGGTGIGEFGLALTPSANLPLSFDLGAQVYTGKREGITGSLHIKFEF